MFEWFRRLFGSSRSVVPKQRPSRPWTETGMRELAAQSPELDSFRQETAALLCALGDPKAAGISDADMDEALGKAIGDYVAGNAPYQGGALAGFDHFITKGRMIRKREDYLHIHERATDEDLECIHIFSVPWEPSGIKYIQVLVDGVGQKALVTSEHQAMEEVSRIRWWLLRENGKWKIHEFGPIFV